MKNIFKFMGVALVASMMLVSCGKDETANYTATATFDGATWTAGDISVKVDDSDVATILLSQTAGQYPQMLLQLTGKDGKTYNVTMGSTIDDEGDYILSGFTGDAENVKALKYYSHAYDYDGTAEANYWPLTATVAVEAFDADNAEITCTVNANMFDYENWFSTDLAAEQLHQLASAITTTMVEAE